MRSYERELKLILQPTSTYEIAIKAPMKNNRIIWTQEMHQRFLVVIASLGSNAAPSKILQAMNVIGLTRIHVASHFQRYKKTLSSSLKEKKDLKKHVTFTSDASLSEVACKPLIQEERNNVETKLERMDLQLSLMSTSCGNIVSSFSNLPLSGFCSCV